MIGNRHTLFSHGFFIEGTLHGLHFPHLGAVHRAHFLQRIRFLKPVWAPVLFDLNPHLHITSLLVIDLRCSMFSTFPIWMASLAKLGGEISYLCSSRISMIGSATVRFFRLYSFWWLWKYSWSFSCNTCGPWICRIACHRHRSSYRPYISHTSWPAAHCSRCAPRSTSAATWSDLQQPFPFRMSWPSWG